jgi:hypothetical protein
VIDAATAEVVQGLVRRESRSLLQYVREAPVWVAPADRPALAKLRALAGAEAAAVEALGQYLQKQRVGLVWLGPFPPEFTDVNDAALHHLLPRLVREQDRAAAALAADLARIADPDARALAERLLALKRQHRAALEALSAQPHTVRGVPG